jgi:hypothetical protein
LVDIRLRMSSIWEVKILLSTDDVHYLILRSILRLIDQRHMLALPPRLSPHPTLNRYSPAPAAVSLFPYVSSEFTRHSALIYFTFRAQIIPSRSVVYLYFNPPRRCFALPGNEILPSLSPYSIHPPRPPLSAPFLSPPTPGHSGN